MEGVRHRMVSVNGISMRMAEKGEGPVVLLHGFPEFWYSWRHQIAGLTTRLNTAPWPRPPSLRRHSSVNSAKVRELSGTELKLFLDEKKGNFTVKP